MSGNVFRMLEPLVSKASPKPIYDVVIVGAGVVGCALARRFAQTGLTVAVVDRASDVGEGGASKSNSAIAHCGFDADPESLEAKLVISASKRWPTLARHLKIPLQSTGALMVARNEAEMESVMKYYKRSLKNGVDDVELLNEQQIRKKEPFIFEGERLLGALHIPREDVVDPFAACQAFAETALVQGNCDFYFQAEVDVIKQEDKYAKVVASKQNLELVGRTVINSAGLGAQRLAEQYGGKEFTLNPRRGQFLVFDNLSKPLLSKILLPVPGPLGKGILITPTIFGNLLAGPTAEDLPMDKLEEGTQTTLDGLELVRSSVFKSLPRLQNFGAVAQYAGARSNCAEGNYLFHYGDGPSNSRIVTLAGIRSTGLSASFAIADEVFEQMEQRKWISPKRAFRCEGRGSYPTWYERQQQASPSMQKQQERRTTVCFCEGVDKQDIQRTLESSPLVPSTTDAIKRRTRATTGRCQGFNCLVDVCKTIASSRNLPVKAISKRGPGTEWFPNYVDTAPLAYDRHSKAAKTELFSRAHLYDSVADPSTAWNHDEQFDVIVVGAGPAGCGAVAGLASSIHIDKVLVLERSDRIGGIPARYPKTTEHKKTFIHFGRGGKLVSGSEFAEELRNEFYLSRFGSKLNLKLHSTVMQIDSLSDNKYYPFRIRTHDGCFFRSRAVIVATGAREATAVERKSVTGHRPAGVVFTNHLLSIGGIDALSHGDSLVVGSGLVPRSVIQSSSSKDKSRKVTYVATPQDEKPWISQLYFGGGPAEPTNNNKEQRISGWNGKIERVEQDRDTRIKKVSNLILGGCLVPNSEMLVRSSMLPTSPPKGVYLIGNVSQSRFGPWPGVACYLHAKHVVARQVLQLFK